MIVTGGSLSALVIIIPSVAEYRVQMLRNVGVDPLRLNLAQPRAIAAAAAVAHLLRTFVAFPRRLQPRRSEIAVALEALQIVEAAEVGRVGDLLRSNLQAHRTRQCAERLLRLDKEILVSDGRHRQLCPLIEIFDDCRNPALWRPDEFRQRQLGELAPGAVAAAVLQMVIARDRHVPRMPGEEDD